MEVLKYTVLSISPLTYKKILVDTDPIIPASEIANWLNLSASIAIANESLIDDITNGVTDVLEKHLWLCLKRTTFEAYYILDYNYFCSFFNGDLKLSIERAPIISLDDITKIEYLNDSDTWTEFDRGAEDIDGLYENTTEKFEQRQWASIYFIDAIPFQERYNAYKIRITFISGFDSTDPVYFLPPGLKLAIKKMIAYNYTHRGDCGGACDINGMPVDCLVKGIIDYYSIARTVLGGSYNPL